MGSRRAAFGCALALLAGCEALFPLDDLGGGRATDAGTSDGAPPPPSDAAPPDVAEAASDAGADADACRGYCACLVPQPSFCDDFDEGGLTAWSTPDTTDGGTVMVVAGAAVSPPNVLRVEVPTVDAGGARASVRKSFGATTTTLRLEVDVFATDWTDDQMIAFDVDANYGVGLVFSAAKVGVFEENGPTQTFNYLSGATPPPTNAWTHVVVDLRLGANPTISLSYGDPDGGATVYTAGIGAPSKGAPTFELGAIYIQSSPTGWRATFDNVVLRYQ
jgi:hypothetical protein